jgi:hypothetical protein
MPPKMERDDAIRENVRIDSELPTCAICNTDKEDPRRPILLNDTELTK